jgi:hypothetical protein
MTPKTVSFLSRPPLRSRAGAAAGIALPKPFRKDKTSPPHLREPQRDSHD